MTTQRTGVDARSGALPTRRLRVVTITMAVACGLAVANLYYAQPLLELIADSFHVGQGTATVVVTMTQLGYALGLLFVLPLGDLINNRKLTSRTMIGTAVALAVAAISPNFGLFVAVSVLIGVTSVVAQILVPLAAHLAPEADRGKVVGQVVSGLLLGILLARSVSSVVADAWGWRTIYVISAVLMVVMSVVLARMLPDREAPHRASYRELMGSVLELARAEPMLRRRSFCQAMFFGAFSAFWTSIAYELIGAHHFTQAGIGLFALVGATGACVAPLAGKLADLGHGHLGSAAAVVIGIGAMLIAGFGSGSVILLGLAAVLLDVAVQAHQAFSQRDIYGLRPDARARVNTVFMTTMFVGGAAATAVTGVLHDSAGWFGVSMFGTALIVLAGIVWGVGHLRRQA
ncbi:MAG TPA: MFS transporter [Pseudonocardiaceae bacterium]|jgi:predicted MFS family arabinose efflux permease|nr:MFS transporter [Pseudonocardiaceae bacterium]